MKDIRIIAHDMRSTHNVGSLLRTAEGLGVTKVYFSGYTPYPRLDGDGRLPHEVNKLHAQIQKTALGAEESVAWAIAENLEGTLERLQDEGFMVAALEQSDTSIELPLFKPPEKLVLLLGNEVTGVSKDLLRHVDTTVEIPMFGTKESFNVVQAAAMALYHVTFYEKLSKA